MEEEENLIFLWAMDNRIFVGEYISPFISFPPALGCDREEEFYEIKNIYEMSKKYIPNSGFKIIATFCGNGEVKFDKMLIFLDKTSEYCIEYRKREEVRIKGQECKVK